MPPEADPPQPPPAAPRKRRFEAAGALVGQTIRKAGETRGFAVARVLTDWADLAGPELARLCRPVRVSYAKKGFGATLVVEAPGAAAPLVQMRLDGLRARINAVYGYAAIARIQLQQGGLGVVSGMAEAPAGFDRAPAALKADNLAPPSAAALARARGVVGALTEGVADEGLKAALDRLAMNVLVRRGQTPAASDAGKDNR